MDTIYDPSSLSVGEMYDDLDDLLGELSTGIKDLIGEPETAIKDISTDLAGGKTDNSYEITTPELPVYAPKGAPAHRTFGIPIHMRKTTSGVNMVPNLEALPKQPVVRSAMDPASILARGERVETHEVSNYLEYLPVLGELDHYSYASAFGKTVYSIPLSKLGIADVLDDIASWRYQLGKEGVPTLSQGYDGVRFKTDFAIRRRFERAVEIGLPYMECFKDILSFRICLSKYPTKFPDYFKVHDMVNSVDANGYRALHLYYQRDSIYYPIEIQIWSQEDFPFNSWYHKYLLKFEDPEVGRRLRVEYDLGNLVTEEEFVSQCTRIY